MSHEVESLAYVSNEENGRWVPWHGLGTPVEKSMTSKEALELAGLNWTVESKPIFTESGMRIPGYIANTRSSDNKVLGIVSNKYSIVQNRDAFEFTDNLIGDEVRYETAGSLCGGKKIWLLAKMPDSKVLDEDFENYICFTNTHDGSGAVRAVVTNTRVVCSNTLSIALKNAKRSWSYKHMGNIESKIIDAQMTLKLNEEYNKEFASFAEEMATSKISESDKETIIKEMFPIEEDMSDRQKRTIEEAKNDFIVCTLSPDLINFLNTKYQYIQAASDFACHRTPARLTSNYQENNFNKIICGHPFIDKMTSVLNSL